MCLGTFSRLARSLATIYSFARVLIVSAFCVIGNSSEFPITQKTTASSVTCLQISAAVFLLFDLFLLYYI